MRKHALLVVTVCCAAALTWAQQAASVDPWAGSWKLDAGKSKLRGPAPQEILNVEAAGQAIVKYTIAGTAADGSQYNEAYDGKSDGKPYPLMVNGQEAGKISYHRISERKSTAHASMADGTTIAETITLSTDGKTITAHFHGKDKQGEFEETRVFNKQ